MEYRTVINKIVFTSPEAMVEFSKGKKLKVSLRAVKNPFNIYKFLFAWKVKEFFPQT